MHGQRHRRPVRTAIGVGLAALLLGACTTSPGTSAQDSGTATTGDKPDIVFVLTDDLAMNLIPYMPQVRQLQKDGMSFSNYYVTDSLCCPSRSSIMTGQFPHNTGVFTNNGSDGGYRAFNRKGDERKSYGPAMQKAGYRTGFMGKYLNGYEPADTNGTDKPYVPPGWDEWDTAGNGYPEFDYKLNENGKVVSYGHDPEDYLTDVVSRKATAFIDASAAAKKPFVLELATFAPHGPATPAPRDADSFPDLKAPRTAAYDTPSVPKPKWQDALKPLSDQEKRSIDQQFDKRVRSVQAVDDMIGHLRGELKAKGIADNTYIVFSSDNGFHMGEHRLRPGKQTAYDTDVRVPLVVAGPGVAAGGQTSRPAENIDLGPTFLDLAGATPAATPDGLSLAPILHGEEVDDWRQAALIEHHHPGSRTGDPDAAPDNGGNPPTYEAIRTPDALWVEYADGEREYYDVRADPDQLHNRASALTQSQRAGLHATLTALRRCEGSKACTEASRLGG
ncbi:sulfatase family protein [Streptomyces adustus]|uniref:sulfatase family protein n=1 Tax=Streptomyces adustus TaxID=1609272 RepID=UPI00371CBC26